MLNAKEIRTLAWNDLAVQQYWPFVGGILVVSLIVGVIAVFGVAIFLAFAFSWADGFTQAELWNPSFLLPTFLLSCVAAVPILYAIGYYTWGATKMSLEAVDRNLKFEQCLSGWGHGWKMCWTLLVQWTYIQLWAFLFVVPGIVKAFAYAMTPFVQVEHPAWTANQCITESRRLMDGNKWRYVCLNLSFIGWWLLAAVASVCVPVAGNFAQTFLYPYLYTAQARFYAEVKREKGW